MLDTIAVKEERRVGKLQLPQWRTLGSWENLSLTAILLLSAFLGLSRLEQNGYSNSYYAAAVKSMLTSWHNFFFASFDAGGFVTIDKPPLAFWIQGAFAKIFGFNGVTLLLPEALAGVLGVFLLYYLVKRSFGAVAGLISALVLAVTPIFVVMNRDNNPDSLMVFFVLLAAWAWLHAAETGKLRWLMFGSVLVGLAFNVKTLAAIVAVPAFFLMYFLVAKAGWRKRIVQLVLAGLVVALVSFSWAAAVDLTPASQRPYVGGSANNSEFNLIFGYNGFGRINGESFGGGGFGGGNNAGGNTNSGTTRPTTTNSDGSTRGDFGGTANSTGTRGGFTGIGGTNNGSANGTRNGYTGGTANGGTRGDFGGNGNASNNGGFFGFGGNNGGGQAFGGPGGGRNQQTGVLRLTNPQLAGEFGWFIPLAVIGFLFALGHSLFGMAKGEQRRNRLQALILWGGWFALYAAVFSVASGIFHSYYLVALAPAQAALVGIGLTVMWKSYRKGGWQAIFLPLALGASAFFQAYVVSGLGDWNEWLVPVLVVLGLVSMAGLALGLTARTHKEAQRFANWVVWGSLAGLLIVPSALSFNALLKPIEGSSPSALPSGGGFGFGGFGGGRATINSSVIDFIKNNLAGQLYLALALLIVTDVLLIAVRLLRNQRFLTMRRVAAGALLVFLLSSSFWWVQTGQAQAKTNSAATAGRNFGGGFAGFGGQGQTGTGQNSLLQFLETNQDGYKFLVAVNSDMTAAPLILDSNQPVISLGGFSGSDPVFTVAEIQQLVANHTVRYFMPSGGRGNNQVTQWITQQCTPVNTSTTTGNSGDNRGFGGGGALYDCSKAA